MYFNDYSINVVNELQEFDLKLLVALSSIWTAMEFVHNMRNLFSTHLCYESKMIFLNPNKKYYKTQTFRFMEYQDK